MKASFGLGERENLQFSSYFTFRSFGFGFKGSQIHPQMSDPDRQSKHGSHADNLHLHLHLHCSSRLVEADVLHRRSERFLCFAIEQGDATTSQRKFRGMTTTTFISVRIYLHSTCNRGAEYGRVSFNLSSPLTFLRITYFFVLI